MLLIGSATAERIHPDSRDQTGEAYIHGYGESLDPNVVRGKHYSARTLQTSTRQHNQWFTVCVTNSPMSNPQRVAFEAASKMCSPTRGKAKTHAVSRISYHTNYMLPPMFIHALKTCHLRARSTAVVRQQKKLQSPSPH